MKKIETQITINAPVEKVWNLLITNHEYNSWNPFIVESSGEVALGKKIKNTMLNGDKTISFTPTITQLKKKQVFEWVGNLFIPGIFDGRHRFELNIVSENKVQLVHSEEFSGFLSGFILSKIETQTRKNFQLMNESLKRIAERE